MTDIYDQTAASYRSEAGAQAFIDKEVRHDDGRREVSSYRLLEGLELATMRMLDVGCGFGRDVAAFRRLGAEAYGCDVSAALLAKARQEIGPYFADYNFRHATALPFEGEFDVIWCCAVLVHVSRDEVEAFLRLLWNGLKRGGRLVLISKQGEGDKVAYNLGDALPRVMVQYLPEEILAIVEPWGMVVERSVPDLSVTAYGEALFGMRLQKT